MAYATSNPPTLRHMDVGNKGPASWTLYGTDAPSVVQVTGFISNAKAFGMKVGDTLFYLQTGVTPAVTATFIVDAITAAGAADLSDASLQTSTNTN